MTLGRPIRSWIAFPLAVLAAGCAGTGSNSSGLLSRPAMVSSLKTSLSNMEYENRQLKNQVARLDADNREIENELLQEKSANGELSARLDDARSLLSQRGLGEAESLELGTARTHPAGQSNKKPRTPPFARIPGRIDPVTPDDNEPSSSSSVRPGEDLGTSSFHAGPIQWYPIADGSKEPPASPRR
jgi:hypothetical protein